MFDLTVMSRRMEPDLLVRDALGVEAVGGQLVGVTRAVVGDRFGGSGDALGGQNACALRQNVSGVFVVPSCSGSV